MVSLDAVSLSDDNARDWEALNERSGHGSLFHGRKWMGILEGSFGLRSHSFIVYGGGEPVALCPLFDDSLRRFSGLATLPRSDMNYLIVREDADREMAGAIMRKVVETAKSQRSSFVRLSFPDPQLRDAFSDRSAVDRSLLPEGDRGVMSLDLDEHSPKDIWDKVFTRKDAQRKYVRRFEQSRFAARETRSQGDLDAFHELYSRNLEAKGARPYGREHFDHLLKAFTKDEMRITMLDNGKEMAGGLVSLMYPAKGTMYLRYIAINRELPNFYHPSIALYWEAINFAYGAGLRRVCFGSTPDDPDNRTYQIKAGFGCRYDRLYASIMPMRPLFTALYRSRRYLGNRKGGNVQDGTPGSRDESGDA